MTNVTLGGALVPSSSKVIDDGTTNSFRMNITLTKKDDSSYTYVLNYQKKNVDTGAFSGYGSFQNTFHLIPVILTNSLTKVPTQGGVSTMNGFFFLNNPQQIFVTTNGVKVNSTSVAVTQNNNAITFPVAEGTGKIDVNVIYKNRNTRASSTYENPTLTSYTNNFTVLAITGKNFGNKIPVFQIRYGDSVVPSDNILSLSHNLVELNCSYIKSSISLIVNVTVDGLVSDKTLTVNFKPKITSITSVPNKGGSVTIKGSYLNAKHDDGTPTTVDIKIGTYKCTGASNLVEGDYTALVCTMPEGTGDQLAISVSIDSIASDPAATTVTFSYAYPHIKEIKQSGNVLTLIGESLGSTTSSVVNFNGLQFKPDSVQTVEDHDELKLTLHDDCRNGDLKMIVNGIKGSNVFKLELVPVIDSIGKTSTKGGIITITGKFLNTKDINLAQLSAKLSANDPTPLECTNLVEFNPPTGTSLQCQIPQGAGKDFQMVLTIGEKSSTPIGFSYTAPSVSKYEQEFGTLYIRGDNFGPSVDNVLVKFQNEDLKPKTLTDHNLIEFIVPPLAKFNGDLVVQVSGQNSNPQPVTLSAVVSQVNNKLSTAGGNLTLLGNFLDIGGENRSIHISFDQFECTNPIQEVANNSAIYCTLASGSGVNHKLNFTIDGAPVLNPNILSFSYNPPRVDSATPSDPKDRQVISISGDSFHMPIEVLIGDRECQYPNVTDFNMITCSLPAWDSNMDDIPEDSVFVNVTVDGQTGSSPVFQYNLTQVYEDRKAAQASRIKWLVPAILIPSLFGVACILGVSIILYKRHKRMKNLQKIFKNNSATT
eukprot:gene5182-6450_t